MEFNFFFCFNLQIFFLVGAAQSNSGEIIFARSGGGEDQSKCFKNLLYQLSDQSFSASSVWKDKAEFKAHQARMATMIDTSASQNGNAWCPNSFVTENSTEWLEIDLGDSKFIRSFFTMGRGDGNFKEFVSFFYLQYQREPNIWIHYKNEQNKELIIGNGDSRNVARTQFIPPIVARKIRIYPINRGTLTRACMRIGIYGCNFDDGVVEYSVPEGHVYFFDENGKFDLRDQTYDGHHSQPTFSPLNRLVGGLGQLMDNMIYQGIINNERYHSMSGYQFVGWNKKMMQSNDLEIILKLDQIRKVNEIKLYTLNVIPNDISVFARATVHFSIGGEIYDQISLPLHYSTVADRRFYHSRWIVIPIRNILTRFLKVNLKFDLDWIVLSEIILITERGDFEIPTEQYTLKPNIPASSHHQHISTEIFIFSKSSIKKENPKDQSNEISFIANSKLGFIVTLVSCFFGLLLLLSLIIFGFIFLKRYNARSTRKPYYPNFPVTSKNRQFIVDSPVVPLTEGTHKFSGIGGFYRSHIGSADLGLSYPIMGKEYMTLSSKSGTDYDMAGGNSLDGLIPIHKDSKYSGLNSNYSQNTFSDMPYSKHSNEGSFVSSCTEYATTSLYHIPNIVENNCNKMAVTQPTFQIHSFSPSHNILNGSSHNFHSPVPQTPMLGPLQNNNVLFPCSPYKQFPYKSPYNSRIDSPYRFQTPPSVNIAISPYSTTYYPPSSLNSDNTLPPLKGIFGNSVMICADKKINGPPLTTLADILSHLTEIYHEDIEHLYTIGRGDHGDIGFTRITQRDNLGRNDIVSQKTFLSKSINTLVLKDIRNEILHEMSILLSIKHSAFLSLSSYAVDNHNSMSTKQLSLCFLFKIDENMENLYTFLQKHSTENDCISNPPRDHHSQSDVDTFKRSYPDTQPVYPSIPSLLGMCYQISEGMRYLEAHRIIHRDLAARNCLIDYRLNVKITDIAISIQIFKEHYSECTTMELQSHRESPTGSSLFIVKQNYPLQWMAFETILKGSYTSKSDIWSFGVTMWEIVNRCEKPPFGTFGIKIDRLVENANQLSVGSRYATLPSGIISGEHYKPSIDSSGTTVDTTSIFTESLGLTRDFSDLLRECWHKNSFQRPSFEVISLFLEQNLAQFKNGPVGIV